jgi:hypothetical protein
VPSPPTGPAATQATTGPAATQATTGNATAESVRGVLERLAVERESASTRSAEITTWVRIGDRRVRIASPAVATVPTGSQVVVRLAPSPPTSDGVREVLDVRVLSRAGVKAVPRAAAVTPHAVTVVLALPAGARADTMTTSRLATAVTTSASRYWSQQSGGRITFTVARSVGWTKLQHGCTDVWGLWEEARRRASFVPGARRHLLVYVPPGAGCPSGLGTVSPSADDGGYALVGGASTALLAHELGHNLGLGHSDALTCAGAADAAFVAQWPSRCDHDDYGDWYDVMGISWDNLGSLSTAHAYRLGLLAAGEVRSVTGPARVVLRPVSGRTGVRSLRVTDPSGAVYVVEYRPADGADAWLDGDANWRGLRSGVLVRRVDPQDGTRTLLLDPTPAASVAAGAADWDRVLGSGRSLRTASGRITIRVEAVSASAATVVVDRDGVSPAVVVTPGGRLVRGAQVTIGEAPAAWAELALG